MQISKLKSFCEITEDPKGDYLYINILSHMIASLVCSYSKAKEIV